MTSEERWIAALEAEAAEPSGWQPDVEAFEAALQAMLEARGCEWSTLSLCVLRARVRSSVSRAEFAARLGLSVEQLDALEGA